jgi:hypothetical protein
MFGYRIHGTELNGLSTIYRMGDIGVKIENGSAIASEKKKHEFFSNPHFSQTLSNPQTPKTDVEIGTSELYGKTFWEVSIAKGMITRGGKLQFVLKHLKINLRVTQPVDLRKKMVIDDLQLDLGNIQVS